MILGHDNDIDRKVRSGLYCSECSTEFTQPHGHPVVCHYCWNLLSLHDRSQITKSTHYEANRVAHHAEGKKRKAEKQAKLAKHVEND